jgi:hypothetical protein
MFEHILHQRSWECSISHEDDGYSKLYCTFFLLVFIVLTQLQEIIETSPFDDEHMFISRPIFIQPLDQSRAMKAPWLVVWNMAGL